MRDGGPPGDEPGDDDAFEREQAEIDQRPCRTAIEDPRDLHVDTFRTPDYLAEFPRDYLDNQEPHYLLMVNDQAVVPLYHQYLTYKCFSEDAFTEVRPGTRRKGHSPE